MKSSKEGGGLHAWAVMGNNVKLREIVMCWPCSEWGVDLDILISPLKALKIWIIGTPIAPDVKRPFLLINKYILWHYKTGLMRTIGKTHYLSDWQLKGTKNG